jgi:hypothetical protein
MKRNSRNNNDIEDIENAENSWFDDDKKEHSPISIKDHSNVKLPALNTVANKSVSHQSPNSGSSSPHRG